MGARRKNGKRGIAQWPLNRDLEIVLHVVSWVLIALTFAQVFERFFGFEMSMLRGVANTLPMVILFYVNFWLVNRFLEKNRFLSYVLSVGMVFMAMTVLRVQINLLFPEIDPMQVLLNQNTGGQYGAVFTNFTAVMISTFYQVMLNRFRNEQRNLAIISEQKEAQLQFLRGQINPHFLFNTLNNIYSLAVVKSDQTADMVLRLSKLLRYVIYDGRAGQVALARELAHIREFVALFRMRSETEPDIAIDVEGSPEGFLIEPMILIPIVENCFKHCDFDINPNAYVRIGLRVQSGRLAFFTENTKDDADKQKDQVGGVGLENIRRRLELKYPEQHRLVIDEQTDRFTVRLELNELEPIRERPAKR